MQQVQIISVSLNELMEIFSQKMKQVLQEEFVRPINNQEKKYLTREEASDFLGLTYGGLHKWVKEGKVTIFKVGNKPYFDRSELESLILGNRK